MVLTVQTRNKPAVTITRTATKATELVYVAVANKKLHYPTGKSRIVYIGTTKKGAERIAASAAAKASKMLGQHGIQYLEFFVVTSTLVAGVKTWHKLERGLLLSFKEMFGKQPECNEAGKSMRWTDELKYFTRGRLDGLVERYSS